MTHLKAWLNTRARRNAGGVVLCGLVAALFLAPALVKGALGPADLLFSMTPWNAYRDAYPELRGVHNPQLDVIQQYYPWRMFIADRFRHNQVPLWNPHAYCGQPFVGNVLSAVFYPFGFAAAVLPIGAFYLLSAWFHLSLLGTGMWLFLRLHGLRWPAALTGAVAAMCNPFVVGWLHYTPVSQWTFAWAPLVLYLWQRAWSDRRPAATVWVALALAQSLLGGHLQISLYVALAWATYATGIVGSERRWQDLVPYVIAPAALAVGLAAIQIAPALEMSALSGREGGDYAATAADAVPLRGLIGLLAPWFYGRNTVAWWGPGANAIEMSMGTGAAAALLGVVALTRRRGTAVWLLGGLALLGVLLALRTPVYALFWHAVPGFSALRGLARALSLWSLAAAALAGFGVQALLEEPVERSRSGRLAVALVAVPAALLLAAWAAEAARSGPTVTTAFSAGATGYVVAQTLVALGAAAAVGHLVFWPQHRRGWMFPLLVGAELFYLGVGQPTAAPARVFFPPLPETDWLQTQREPFRMIGVPGAEPPPAPFLDWMPMNTPLAYGLSSPSGSESLSVGRYRELLSHFAEPGWEPRLDSPLLNLVGVRYALSRDDLTVRAGWPRVGGERVGIYENPLALPLGFASTAWRTVPEAQQFAALTTTDFAPYVPLVSTPPPGRPTQRPVGRLVPLDPRAHSPQRWSMAGEMPAAGFAVLTQTNVPGWQVWRNGRREAPVTVDSVFMGLPLEPGAVSLRWVWRPACLAGGYFASLLALLLSAAWLAAAGARAAGGPASRARRRPRRAAR